MASSVPTHSIESQVNILSTGDKSREDDQLGFHRCFPLTRDALILYTSGTVSGKPKGCVISHDSIMHQCVSASKARSYTPADVLLHVLPLHSHTGLINGLTAALYSGARIEIQRKFNARRVWFKWCGGSITKFAGVPHTYAELVKTFDKTMAGHNFLEFNARAGARKMRLCVNSGAPLSPAIKRRFYDITRRVVMEEYSLTETGIVLSRQLQNRKGLDGAVGWPVGLPHVRLINDPDFIEKPQGEWRFLSGPSPYPCAHVAHVEVKAEPGVLPRYWRRPEDTAKALTSDGWFRTGDMATVDVVNDKYYIQGRKGVDVIRCGGRTVLASEIEEKMLAMEEVDEVVVVGIEDEGWGQRVAAVVKQKRGVSGFLLSHEIRISRETCH